MADASPDDDADAAAVTLDPTTGDFAASTDIALAWEHDVLAVSPDALEATTAEALWRYVGAPAGVRTRASIFGIVADVRRGMGGGAAYHDFSHGSDVALVALHFLFRSGGADVLGDPLARLAVAVAALGHDVDHPGLTNAYVAAGNGPLARRYPGLPVLEAHSAATTARFARERGLLDGFGERDARRAREAIAAHILATDMANHGALVDGLRRYAGGARRGAADDARLLGDALLHCADLSNAARPWPIAKKWSDRILEEFFAQGDLERSSGAPKLSYGCDRAAVKQPAFALAFGDNLCGPLFAAAAQILPPLEATARAGLDDNRTRWLARRDADDAAGAGDPPA